MEESAAIHIEIFPTITFIMFLIFTFNIIFTLKKIASSHEQYKENSFLFSILSLVLISIINSNASMFMKEYADSYIEALAPLALMSLIFIVFKPKKSSIDDARKPSFSIDDFETREALNNYLNTKEAFKKLAIVKKYKKEIVKKFPEIENDPLLKISPSKLRIIEQ